LKRVDGTNIRLRRYSLALASSLTIENGSSTTVTNEEIGNIGVTWGGIMITGYVKTNGARFTIEVPNSIVSLLFPISTSANGFITTSRSNTTLTINNKTGYAVVIEQIRMWKIN